MKPGQSFDCAACGRNSFLKKESVLEGWVKKGEVLKCAACGAVVEVLDGAAEKRQPDREDVSVRTDALAALLGETGPEKNPGRDLFREEKRFCRDCVHRVANAFRMRCALHDRDVHPMEDCPDFSPRGEAEKCD